MRESWTDERMDDLNHRVDEGFRRNDEELRALRTEVRTEFVAVRGELWDLRAETNAGLGATQRLILQVGGGTIATLMVGFLGLIATQL